MSSAIAELADTYVERAAALDPVAATFEGLPGHDDRLTDYSPDGIAERLAHDRATLHELSRLEATTDGDRVAAEVMRRSLELDVELVEAGEPLRALRVIDSPVSSIRMVFDLMPRETEEDWDAVAARTAAVPQALSSFQDALTEGAHEGLPAARRQVVACAEQADTWGGLKRGATPFFLGLVEQFDASGLDVPALRARLEDVRAPRHHRLRVARPVPRRGVRARRDRPGRGRRRAVRAHGTGVHRHHARLPGDLRLGLERARAHRGGHGRASATASSPASRSPR